MGNEITNKTHVLVTSLGDFWLSAERGANVMQAAQRQPHAQFDIDGNFITARSIEGLLSAAQYSVMQNKRRGMWQCKYEVWHTRFEQCYCARNQQYKNVKYEPYDDRAKRKAA